MWLIIFVVVIIMILIAISGTSNTTDSDIKRITEFVFGPCDIKPYKKYSKEELKKLLGLYDKDIYLDKFSSGIMHRGEIYYYENKIEDYNLKDNIHTCKITGSSDYSISLKLNNDDVEEMSCTCPHYIRGNNCKHIFALLYSLKCSENKKKIIKNIEMQIVPTSTLMVKYFDEYCKRNINKFPIDLVKNAVGSFDNAITEINNCVEELKGKNTEDTALNILKTIYDAVYEIRENIITIMKNQKGNANRNVARNVYSNNSNSTPSLLTTLLIMDELNKKDNLPINKSPFSEKEMDYYGLDDFEKDLVRKGEYAPWDFEHEDTVEGDYYHYD